MWNHAVSRKVLLQQTSCVDYKSAYKMTILRLFEFVLFLFFQTNLKNIEIRYTFVSFVFSFFCFFFMTSHPFGSKSRAHKGDLRATRCDDTALSGPPVRPRCGFPVLARQKGRGHKEKTPQKRKTMYILVQFALFWFSFF